MFGINLDECLRRVRIAFCSCAVRLSGIEHLMNLWVVRFVHLFFVHAVVFKDQPIEHSKVVHRQILHPILELGSPLGVILVDQLHEQLGADRLLILKRTCDLCLPLPLPPDIA